MLVIIVILGKALPRCGGNSYIFSPPYAKELRLKSGGVR